MRLATQTLDVTTHGGPLDLCHSRRTTAGKKLDTILEAEKEPFPLPEPEPAGTELKGEDNDVSRNTDGTEDVQNTKMVDQSCSSPLTFPVTAIQVRKANTPKTT